MRDFADAGKNLNAKLNADGENEAGSYSAAGLAGWVKPSPSATFIASPVANSAATSLVTAALIATSIMAGAFFAAPARAQTEEPDDAGIQFAPDDPEDHAPVTTRRVPAPDAGSRLSPTSPGGGAPGDQVEPPTHNRTAIEHGGGDPHPASTNKEPEGDQPNRISPRDHRDPTLFGSYRVRLMYARPVFNDGLKYYNYLYGQPKGYPEIAADWFAFDYFATLGLSLRMGYYTADGHAAQNATNNPAPPSQWSQSDLAIDPNGPTSLTLIPLQLLIAGEFTPFRKKWVVIDGWAGLERLYYQETRNAPPAAAGTTTATATTSNSASCSTAPASPTTGTTGTTGTSTTATTSTTNCAPVDTTLTNTGWVTSIVFGVAANILLNPLDEESSRSAAGGTSVGSIYVSPYMEWIKGMNHPHPSFGRTVYGIAFTFETLN